MAVCGCGMLTKAKYSIHFMVMVAVLLVEILLLMFDRSSPRIKVGGVLRQSADVEEVERREKEYEQGKTEFSADEDAHIIGDCIKHVLRELPSSTVPASCCTALVEAYKADRGRRIKAIRGAIDETLPEPNLRLLQSLHFDWQEACGYMLSLAACI